MERVTLTRVARQSQMSLSRATIKSVEDDHLMQEVAELNGYYSETHTNKGAPIERWQMVGVTSVPLKQGEDKNKQQQSGKESDGFNNNQPKGPAAEALMLDLGSHSHRVAIVDDRRVRPYGMKEGRGGVYAPDGSEQMLYFKQDGTYLVSLDGKSVEKPDGNETRKLVTGHVTKKMQTHKIEKNQQQQEEYKHEGDSINTGTRYTKDRIEFVADNVVVGYYDKSSKKWHFEGDNIEHEAKTISQVASTRFETVGKTYLGIDNKGESAPLSETGDVPFKQTYVKLA